MTMTRPAVPTFDDLNAAARRLEGIAHRTPVMLRSTSADESTGGASVFKCENLQRTGRSSSAAPTNTWPSSPRTAQRGVLAFLPGNHAQAIALSARLLDMPAVIVMPEDAPRTKMAATREYGAQW